MPVAGGRKGVAWMVDKISRQMFILSKLAGSSKGYSAEELHRLLEHEHGIKVSVRSVYRDLDDLSVIFQITEEERQGRTYYILVNKYTLAEIQFDFQEMMALMLMARLMEGLGNDPVMQAGRALAEKIISKMPKFQRQYLESLQPYFRVELPGQGGERPKLLQTFLDAARTGQEVTIRYRSFSSNQVSTRVIHPYTVYFRNNYYIVAWCTQRQDLREFRLDRVEEARLETTQFQVRENFDYEAYSRGRWDAMTGSGDYQVVLHFSPHLARFIREYHGARADKLVDLPDGSLEFHKTVSILDEVYPWILSHGSGVAVLSPPELKEMVAETIRAMAAQL